MEQFNKFITAQQIKEVKIEFENVFQKSLNIWTNINKFTDFKNGDIFNLHAFKKTGNNENCKFIIFDNDKQIKIYGNSQLNGFFKKCINDNPQDYQYLKGDIYYLFRDCIAQPTATITIKDCEYDNGNKKINLIINPNPLIFKLEDPIITYTYCNYTDEDLTKQKVVKKTYINVKDLNENDEFYIYSIYQVKDRYIFKMLDKDLKPINDNIYCGNYYINTNEEIKKIYENKTITQPFKIVIGKPKTTPQNNKAVYIYVVINNIEE
jgi:hypothetical protein